MRTPKETKELILEKLAEVGAKPAKWLTRKLVIDKEGNLHSFWGEGEEMQHHQYQAVDDCINEHLHVLDKYRGDLEEIRGQEILIPGEQQRLQTFIRKLQDFVNEFLVNTPLPPDKERCLRQDLDWIVTQIGQTTESSKRQARAGLTKLAEEPLKNEKGRRKPALALQAMEATERLLERNIDVLNKISGTVIRLRRLVEERYRSMKIIFNVCRQLACFLGEFKDNKAPSKERLREIANQVYGGKANLVAGLESILVQPYLRRIRSSDVQRLKRIQKHLDRYLKSGSAKDLKTFYNTLYRPYQKLVTPYRQYQAQKRKKPIINEEGRLKI